MAESGRRPQRRLAGPGRSHPAPAGRRQPARRAGTCPSRSYVHLVDEVVDGLARGSGEYPAGRPGHAGHGRPHPHDQPARRADAGQEHVLLSEAAQRAGHQPAGITVPRGTPPPRRLGQMARTAHRARCRCSTGSVPGCPVSGPGRDARVGRATLWRVPRGTWVICGRLGGFFWLCGGR